MAPWRLLFLAPAALSLLLALWGGVIRLGFPLPPPTPAAVAQHGPLMVTGFLGTLIGLERAVALRRGWAYGAPLLTGLAALALLAGAAPAAGALAVGGSLVLAAVFAVLVRRQPQTHLLVMGSGTLAWVAGSLLWWLGEFPPHRVAPWFAGFVVLTIAGERLELSRVLDVSTAGRAAFRLAAGAVGAGLLLGAWAHAPGVRLAGLGLLGLALWLLRYDIAWRSLDRPGRPRFMALCLLSGHAWLGAGGLLWLLLGDRFVAGAAYDAMLHAVFVGFVFSMIFGHAPIILPAVLGVALPFRRAFYLHWALLQASLLLRIGGDLAGWGAGQRWGGLGNAAAVLLFLVLSAGTAALGALSHGNATTHA
jgi:hypothetical protein